VGKTCVAWYERGTVDSFQIGPAGE